jgi:hypothetical protein
MGQLGQNKPIYSRAKSIPLKIIIALCITSISQGLHMHELENKDEKIKITYEPFKEIIIKEYTKFEKIEDLIYIFAQLRASGAHVSLNWANGLVFVSTVLPPENDLLVKDFLEGKIYWASVTFAAMPEYKPIFETKEKIQVPVLNASSNVMIRQVTEWLKQQK